MMTFYQKLQAHEGGLVRLDIPEKRTERFLSGKTGVVCSVDVRSSGTVAGTEAAKVTLLIDGKIHAVFLYEEETQFLEGSG